MSLAQDNLVRNVDRAPDAPAITSRAAAVAKLIAAVQTLPGHVFVIGTDANAAATLFDEAEAHLRTHRSTRMRGQALDGSAAVAALCADREQTGSRDAWQRAAMQALVEEARAVALPVLVVVTEADAVPAARLERFRQAVDCVTDAADVVRVVFLGGPRLMKSLRRPGARSLATRMAALIRVPDATGAPAENGLGRRPAGVTRRYAYATALGGIIAVAAWMIAPRILRGNHVAEPLSTLLVMQPEDPPQSPLTLTAPEEKESALPAPPPPVADLVASRPPPVTARTPRPAPLPALQVGAFLSASSGEALRRRLTRFGEAYVSTVDRDGSSYHRVRLGGFTSEADLRATEAALRKAGYAPVRARESAVVGSPKARPRDVKASSPPSSAPAS